MILKMPKQELLLIYNLSQFISRITLWRERAACPPHPPSSGPFAALTSLIEQSLVQQWMLSSGDERTQKGLWLACWELWGHSPFEVVLEATAFSLTSVLEEHFPMAFSAFFLSVVVELWDWASIMSSHYFSLFLKGMPIKHHNAIKVPKW